MNAPTLRRQRIVGRLFSLLLAHADRVGGEAFVSPVDVDLADHSIVQPDVVYVAPGRSSILTTRVEGAPDLVIEILSPSTARRDIGEKLRLYAEAGCSKYWIVDPALETLELLERAGEEFRVRVPESAIYRSAVIAGLEIDLEAFWRTVPV